MRECVRESVSESVSECVSERVRECMTERVMGVIRVMREMAETRRALGGASVEEKMKVSE